MNITQSHRKTNGYPTYWNTLRVFPVPSLILQNDEMVLKGHALSVLLVVLEAARTNPMKGHAYLTTKLSQKDLVERTGLKRARVSAGIRELNELRFLISAQSHKTTTPKRINRLGQFDTGTFTVCNPSTGKPLQAGTSYYTNGLRYLHVPSCVIREEDRWALRNLTSSQLKLYLAVIYTANPLGRGDFEVDSTLLRKRAKLSTETFVEALEALEARGLVEHWFGKPHRTVSLELLDPYTGHPISSPEDSAQDPKHYYEGGKKGERKRYHLNNGDPEHTRAQVLAALPTHTEVIESGVNSVTVTCPFHNGGREHTPSLAIDFAKRVWYCHSRICKERGDKGGHLVQLFARLQPENPFKLPASVVGQNIEYVRPDSDAEAIYRYMSRDGKTLLKEKLRFPGKEFKQRRKDDKGNWVDNVIGVQPSLYRQEHLDTSRLTLVSESEKDCDVLMNLDLRDNFGNPILGVSPGGADQWRDEFADDILELGNYAKKMHVCVLPHDDEAGEGFLADVIESFAKRGIQVHVVRFTGTEANDAAEFVELHGRDAFIHLMDEWIRTTVSPEPELQPEYVTP